MSSFPTTPVLTTFTGTDENPLSESGAWTSTAELSGMQRITNQARAVSAFGESYRTTFSEVNLEVYTKKSATSGDLGLKFRFRDNGGASPIRDSRRDGYQVTSIGATQYSVSRLDNGTNSTILSATAWTGGNIAGGDSFGARMIGSQIEVWLFRVSTGLWVLQNTVTDATHTLAGTIAMQMSNTTTGVDDFGGGQYLPGGLALLGVG